MGVYKVFWRLLCKLLEHFSGTLEVDENEFSKIGSLPEEKQFWVTFVLPSMADNRQHFVRRHKLFWQSLCKVLDQFRNT